MLNCKAKLPCGCLNLQGRIRSKTGRLPTRTYRLSIITDIAVKSASEMRNKSPESIYHIIYWAFVLLFLTVLFGRSWNNNLAAFYFIAMLLPIVLGTSYFFNYYLVPRFLLKKEYFRFGLYTFYALVVSLYLETIVLMFSFIYLGNFSFHNLNPNASDTLILAVVLYFLVFLGSFLLLLQQVGDHKKRISELLIENSKQEEPYLEVLSNRKMAKILYRDIEYIESHSDYVSIHTSAESILTKEKISHLAESLPSKFLRIHRSFIVNKDKITSYSNQEISVGETQLNIGRSYKKEVQEALKG